MMRKALSNPPEQESNAFARDSIRSFQPTSTTIKSSDHVNKNSEKNVREFNRTLRKSQKKRIVLRSASRVGDLAASVLADLFGRSRIQMMQAFTKA